MRRNFVTLFNSAYLSRGLTLYRSLQKNCTNFHLYVIAFDDFTYKFLSGQHFPGLTAIPLQEFEDEELRKVKAERSATEYCWTCTPSTIYYCINRFGLDHCIYIDADMYFFSDPQPLYDEWGSRSILITRHRFSKPYEEGIVNGIYCVQYVGFKNDETGMKALKWWREACIAWCYHRLEEGKFGDQKYLDDWADRFSSVCDLAHPGGGVAPWNVQQYEFTKKDGGWEGRVIQSGLRFPLVFFHFHSLKIYTNKTVAFSAAGYDLQNRGVYDIYAEYVTELLKTSSDLHEQIPHVNVDAATAASPFLPAGPGDKLKSLIKKLTGRGEGISHERKNLHYQEDFR